MSESQKAIALELTKIHYHVAVAKNAELDPVHSVYLGILNAINGASTPDVQDIILEHPSDSTVIPREQASPIVIEQ